MSEFLEAIVPKIGTTQFDAAQAYGLGIVLASISDSEVAVFDEGYHYRLIYQKPIQHISIEQCIKKILEIPTVEELKSYQVSMEPSPLALKNLDGLLGVKFTSPGVRAVSVRDMFKRTKTDLSVAERSLAKATLAVERLAKNVAGLARRQSNWIDHLLSTYKSDQFTVPIPVIRREQMIGIPMTIDPAWSYSTRRPISDGMVFDKANLSFEGAPYAPLLVNIGAVRFLRAQRVAGDLVNFYMPIAKSITLSAKTALPLLSSSSQTAHHTIVKQWIGEGLTRTLLRAQWNSLAYQIMQTQGTQQSISVGRGSLDYTWLEAIEQVANPTLITYWRNLLQSNQDIFAIEIDNLIDSLLYRESGFWIAHLRDVALRVYTRQGSTIRPYYLSEVKGILRAMSVSITSPLRAVLERDKGTIRFGHALRLLGRYKPQALRDYMDVLDTVHDRNKLMRLLAQVVQECNIISSKTPFIIIPDDTDLIYLLEDIEQYGALEIAGLLIILSALNYPRVSDNRANTNDTDTTSEV